MFKDRLKKWGLGKHLNFDEALAISRAKATRDAADKKTTEFRRQGSDQLIFYDAVEHYLLRNPGAVERFRRGEGRKSLETLRIICRTPPLARPERFLVTQGTLRWQEDMFSAIRDFFDVYCSSSEPEVEGYTTIPELSHSNELLRVARYAVSLGDPEAIRLINEALNIIAAQVKNLGPLGLIFFLGHMHTRATEEGGRQVGEIVVRHVAELTEHMRGHRHPAARILAAISRKQEKILISDWHKIHTRFLALELQSCVIEVPVRVERVKTLLDALSWGSCGVPGNEGILYQLRNSFFPRGVPESSQDPTLFWQLNQLLYETYADIDELTKALETMQDCINGMRQCGASSSWYETWYMYAAGWAHYRLGNLRDATHYFRTTLCMSVDSGFGVFTIRSLGILVRILPEIGQYEEAEVFRNKLNGMVQESIAKCEPLEAS